MSKYTDLAEGWAYKWDAAVQRMDYLQRSIERLNDRLGLQSRLITELSERIPVVSEYSQPVCPPPEPPVGSVALVDGAALMRFRAGWFRAVDPGSRLTWHWITERDYRLIHTAKP